MHEKRSEGLGKRASLRITARPIRTLSDLPGPHGLPVLGNLLLLDVSRLHTVLGAWAIKFGPSYRFQVETIPSLCDTIEATPHRTWTKMRLMPLVFALVGVSGPTLAADGPSKPKPVASSDPYSWMEDSSRASELRDWIVAASKVTVAELGALPERTKFKALLEQSTTAGVQYFAPIAAKGRLFYRQLDAGAQLQKLVVREGSVERVLFDPALFGAKPPAINNYSVAPDGATVAIHVSEGGGEVGEIRFLDVASGRQLPHKLSPVWGEFQANWLNDETVVYTAMRDGPGDPIQDMRVLVRSVAGEGPGQLVLGGQLKKPIEIDSRELPGVEVPRTSDWVLGWAGGARADARVFVAPAAELSKSHAAWREVAGYSDQIRSAALLGDRLFLLTTRRLPNGEVLVQDLRTDAKPTALYSDASLVLSQVAATKAGLYVFGQRDGAARLLFLPAGKGSMIDVDLPFEGSISNVRTSMDGETLLFGLGGWSRTREFFIADRNRLDSAGLSSAIWSEAARFRATRTEAVSADGTRVPLVILASGTAENVPTLLSAYGSYGILTTEPFYSPYLASWVANGGALAFCGTRGGGERGRSWHEAGRSSNKPKAHEDYIACAERLAELGVASAKQLAATGTSAGGLLTPPAVIKRPELFAALIPRVAVLNATRLAIARNGPNQFAEMGDPNTPDGLRALAAQDSYLLLESATDLPDTLVIVGLNDRRVEPWMSAKFAARAHDRFGTHRKIYVRADSDAGHGVGSTRGQLIEEWADTFAFAWTRVKTR